MNLETNTHAWLMLSFVSLDVPGGPDLLTQSAERDVKFNGGFSGS